MRDFPLLLIYLLTYRFIVLGANRGPTGGQQGANRGPTDIHCPGSLHDAHEETS